MAAERDTEANEAGPNDGGPNNTESPRGLTPDRINRIAIAMLLSVGIAFFASVIAAAGIEGRAADAANGGARLGGDYPAFHAAGSIVLSGDFDQIYDDGRHIIEQADLVPDGYLGFAYPPHVAFAYAPLAALGFRLGYFLHSLAMAGALIAAIMILRKPVPFLDQYLLPSIAGALTFYPLLRAVSGGQNTAFTVLVFASVWRLLHDDRNVLAGVAVGLLWFRPQYVIPLLGLLFLAKRFQTVAVAVAMAVATWLFTAAWMGPSWTTLWTNSARSFIERDEVNAPLSISPIGFFQALAGGQGGAAAVLGAACTSVVVFVLILIWYRADVIGLPARMGAIATGVLLISPHVLFYDVGLLVIAAAAVLASATTPETQRRAVRLVGLGWLAALLHPVAGALDLRATPLAVVTALVFVGLARLAWNQVASPPPVPADVQPISR